MSRIVKRKYKNILDKIYRSHENTIGIPTSKSIGRMSELYPTFDIIIQRLSEESELEKHKFILKNQKFLFTIMSIEQFKETILKSERALRMPDGYSYAEKILF